MGTELRGARSRRLCTKEPWEGDWSERRGRKEGSSLRLKEFIGHSADTLCTRVHGTVLLKTYFVGYRYLSSRFQENGTKGPRAGFTEADPWTGAGQPPPGEFA